VKQRVTLADPAGPHPLAFIGLLEQLPIVMDADTSARCATATLEIDRRYRLPATDASHLEIALRMQRRLATLDRG
jgi:predicted nucleic acid-binding protein